MLRTFTETAWRQYVYWENQYKKTLDKINRLLQSIEHDGILCGEGKPERLKYGAGYSRRIDDTNRLVYDVKDDTIIIKICKGHY